MPAARVHIRIEGLAEARERLTSYRTGFEALGKSLWLVGTNAPYAAGIETGRTLSGRVARAAGGLYYLKAAGDDVRPRLRQLAEAALEGPAVVYDVGARLAHQALTVAMGKLSPFPYSPRTRRRTGNLRRSLHVASARSR